MEITEIYFADFEHLNKEMYTNLETQVRILEKLANNLSSAIEGFTEKGNNK